MISADRHRAGTVIDLLRLRAEETPEDVATFHRLPTGAWVSTTWAALWAEVQLAAAAFGRLGLKGGDVLAVQARTCREWQIAELGANLAGAAVLGIDTQASSDQAAWILEHAGAVGVVSDDSSKLAAIPVKIRKRLKFVVSLDDGSTSLIGVRRERWRAAMTSPGGPARDRSFAPNPDTPAILIYTSGTTGSPKGIEYTHGQLMTACWTMVDECQDLEQGRFVCWLPMSALFQRMMNLIALAGASVTYFVEDPREIMARLPEIRPTVITSVPRFYEKVHDGIQAHIAAGSGLRKRLMQAALAVGAEWSQQRDTRASWMLRIRHSILDRLVLKRIRAVLGGEIRWMITGSAATPVWLLEFFRNIGLLVLEAYGVTENPIPVAANRPDAYRFGSVGKPFSLNDVRIAADGEVLVKGSALFRGYVGEGRPRERFTSEGFYRTGDYGHFDSDGFLYLKGRGADMIKTTTGRRISPAAIEGVYRQSEYVDQIVVIGNNRPHLVALIALNRSAVEAGLTRLNSAVPPADGFATSPSVIGLIDRDLAALGEKLAAHERIQAFSILPRPLSIESGEITATLKFRRDRIEGRHGDVIESMYTPERGQMPFQGVHAGFR